MEEDVFPFVLFFIFIFCFVCLLVGFVVAKVVRKKRNNIFFCESRSINKIKSYEKNNNFSREFTG